MLFRSSILKKASLAVVRISNRLVPKIRELETQRLKRMHEEALETVPVSGNAILTHTINHLAGNLKTQDPTLLPDPAQHVKRMKQFRRMEG